MKVKSIFYHHNPVVRQMKLSKTIIKIVFGHHNPVTLGMSKVKVNTGKKLVKNMGTKQPDRWARVGHHRLVGLGHP